MLDYFFDGMNVYQLVVWFFIFSFLGWAMECVVIRREKGYWENRGFAKMPFCVIYGFGVFAACILFKPISHNYIALYFAGAIGATAFEYLTAKVMQYLFGEVWWDYTHKKFNYKGILCLESTIGWGFLALFIFGFLNKAVQNVVRAMNVKFVALLSLLLFFGYLIDLSYHFIHSYHNNQNSDTDEPVLDEFEEDEDYTDMKNAW